MGENIGHEQRHLGRAVRTDRSREPLYEHGFESLVQTCPEAFLSGPVVQHDETCLSAIRTAGRSTEHMFRQHFDCPVFSR
jgi:hypothetical protein